MDPISLDIPGLVRIIAASLVGAILCLDKIIVQFMLSRPIVVAPIVGVILGSPMTGLTVGALIEIFWVNKSPLGTFVPPNDSVVSIIIAITAITLGAKQPLLERELLVLSILLFLPVGFLSQKLEILTARFNESFSEKAILSTEVESPRMRNISPAWPILIYFIFTLALIVLPLSIGLMFIPWMYDQLPPFAQMALFYTYYPLPLIGVAILLTTKQHKKTLLHFSIIFIVASLCMDILGLI